MICPAGEYVQREKKTCSAHSLLLPCPYRRQGAGGPSRLSGLPGDGRYQQHSMAVSAPICTPQGSSLCGWGTFLQSLCTAAERKALRIAAHFIGELLSMQRSIRAEKRGACESFLLVWDLWTLSTLDTCSWLMALIGALWWGSDQCWSWNE